MSPAQLHRRTESRGYSGTAVDVWAAGVLLVVMLLGAPSPSILCTRTHACAFPAGVGIWVQC